METTETNTNKQIAQTEINRKTPEELVVYVSDLLDLLDGHVKSYETSRSMYRNLKNIVEEFVKETILDNDVSVDDVKRLADNCGIELTKELQVEMTIRYYATVQVPIDYDADDITESDIDVSVEFTPSGDAEVTSDSTETEDFSVEEI